MTHMSSNKTSNKTNDGKEAQMTDTKMDEWIKVHHEAAAKVDELTAQHDEAEVELAEIEASWERGEDDKSAEDYAIAQADVKRFTALLTAAENHLSNVERARPSDLTLALAIAEPISQTFGESVKVARSDDEDGIVLVPSGEVGLSSGVLSGTVMVHRDAMKFSAGIDTDALDAALRDVGIFANLRTMRRGDRDAVELDVLAYAPEGLPVVPNEPDRDVYEVMVENALAVAESMLLSRDVPIALDRRDNGRVRFTSQVSHRIEADENGDQVRKTTVFFQPNLGGGYTSGLEVRQGVDRVKSLALTSIGSDLGMPIPHVGTITEIGTSTFTLAAYVDHGDE